MSRRRRVLPNALSHQARNAFPALLLSGALLAVCGLGLLLAWIAETASPVVAVSRVETLTRVLPHDLSGPVRSTPALSHASCDALALRHPGCVRGAAVPAPLAAAPDIAAASHERFAGEGPRAAHQLAQSVHLYWDLRQDLAEMAAGQRRSPPGSPAGRLSEAWRLRRGN